MSKPYITSPSDFRGYYAQLCEVFDPSKRLPEQVFRGSLGRCAFVEFDLMLSRDFGSLLASFAARGGDTEVYVFVLDPDPETYYFSHFQRYGAFKLKAQELETDYFPALRAEPEGSPADAMLYVADVVALFGDTKSWAIWGERELGVGVVADQGQQIGVTEPGRAPQSIKWFDVESAISNLVALNFRGQITPPDIAAKFRTHYGAPPG